MWGIVLSTFASVSNFAGAMTVRAFLGIFEAAVTPGFAFITSQWYTKEEQGLRVAIWFSFNGWAQIVGGVVAYGIAVGVQEHGAALHAWRIIFLVTGLLTACVGVVFFFVVPDNQLNARWLNQRDRLLAVERIRKNQQGVGNKHWKAYQFKEALTDPLSWALFFYALVADIPNGGISNFFSIIITGIGYTPLQSLLYGTPGGAVEIVTILAWGFATRYYGNRLLFSSVSMVLALLGAILLVALPRDNHGGRLGGYYLTQASAVPFVALLSLISTNVAGYTKKTTVAAMYLIAYCAGNIIVRTRGCVLFSTTPGIADAARQGPQTFRSKDAPRYVPAEATICACYGACLLILAFIYCWCKRKNAQKARVRAQPGYEKLLHQVRFHAQYSPPSRRIISCADYVFLQEFLDLTDGG